MCCRCLDIVLGLFSVEVIPSSSGHGGSKGALIPQPVPLEDPEAVRRLKSAKESDFELLQKIQAGLRKQKRQRQAANSVGIEVEQMKGAEPDKAKPAPSRKRKAQQQGQEPALESQTRLRAKAKLPAEVETAGSAAAAAKAEPKKRGRKPTCPEKVASAGVVAPANKKAKHEGGESSVPVIPNKEKFASVATPLKIKDPRGTPYKMKQREKRLGKAKQGLAILKRQKQLLPLLVDLPIPMASVEDKMNFGLHGWHQRLKFVHKYFQLEKMSSDVQAPQFFCFHQ